MDYETMLKMGMKKVPKECKEGDRFAVPKVRILPSGAKTIIMNFPEIANVLRRERDHLLKFLLKELATKGGMDGEKLIVQGRFKSDMVDRKIELYVKEYVLCPDCCKPDTKFVREDRYMFLKCEACGSKHMVKKV